MFFLILFAAAIFRRYMPCTRLIVSLFTPLRHTLFLMPAFFLFTSRQSCFDAIDAYYKAFIDSRHYCHYANEYD